MMLLDSELVHSLEDRVKSTHNLVAHQQFFDPSDGEIDLYLQRSLEQLKLLNGLI